MAMRVFGWPSALLLTLSWGTASAGYQLQGYQLQGSDLQGFSSNGKKEVLVSFPYAGLRRGNTRIVNVRVERGELTGEVRRLRPLRAGHAAVRSVRLRGADFAGVTLVGKLDTGGQLEVSLPFRITAVTPEVRKYEPATLPEGARGGTWLYRVEVRDPKLGWRPACTADADGRRVAIPVAARWNRTGLRLQSTKRFTLSCTTGVIAKCYRWGYRPWFEPPENPRLWRRTHWSCTRMARADYCGDGVSRTRDGTPIYEWDNLRPPVAPPLVGAPTTMLFESGWSTCGAVCLSRFRWQNWPAVCPPTTSCLYRPVAGATGGAVVPNVCDTPAEAAAMKDPQGRLLRLFNLSNKNAVPPG